MSDIEVWVGLECTVNRITDRFFDQCIRSGHENRLEDLKAFAELGISKIRYPFVWEKIEAKEGVFQWDPSSERLFEMRRLKIDPIAGLLHHGSGPTFTNLLDPDFPLKFSRFARAFAERFPWITDYTPINEPLTTARFSGLYGVWYPHRKDDLSFLQAFTNQIRGIVLAMQEIRKVNPHARLIQTEDLGRATGTAPLQYQVEFENERRWLSFDFLCGRVNASHFLFSYLKSAGLKEKDLAWFAENPLPPGVLGINHYPLSNRFLDHDITKYPAELCGGNAYQRYADVGAPVLPTASSIYEEVWQRYRLPVAATEVHIAGPREAQLRWLQRMWTGANEARANGVDFRAMTVWSLLGSFDWNSLCTQENGFYESGIFDVRGSKPRPTAIAAATKSFAQEKKYSHPVLRSAPLLIAGTGTLGRAFARICEARGLPYRILGRKDMDIADMASVRWAIHEILPWAVINTAGYVDVDRAEREPERCYRENVLGAQSLAMACSEKKIRFLTFSSDLVFDGRLTSPYLESHSPSPLNVYGKSKVESEVKVQGSNLDALIVRTSSFFGPWDQANFLTRTLQHLKRRQSVDVARNVRISPTYVPDLVNACLDLLIDGEKGILHLTNQGEISWSEFAQLLLQRANRSWKLDRHVGLLREKNAHEMGWVAPRPLYSALGSERARVLPSIDDALHRYTSELNPELIKQFILEETL